MIQWSSEKKKMSVCYISKCLKWVLYMLVDSSAMSSSCIWFEHWLSAMSSVFGSCIFLIGIVIDFILDTVHDMEFSFEGATTIWKNLKLRGFYKEVDGMVRLWEEEILDWGGISWGRLPWRVWYCGHSLDHYFRNFRLRGLPWIIDGNYSRFWRL